MFVTHDQEEALTMSDRVAVMRDGRIEQAGSPRDVYEEPRTMFVADFLGVSNLLEVEALGQEHGASVLRLADRTLRAEQGETEVRGQLKAMIRPERIGVEPHGTAGDNRLPGMVERSVFLGGSYEIHVRLLGGATLKVAVANDGDPLTFGLELGTPVMLYLPPDALRVLRPDPEPEVQSEDGETAAASVAE